MAPVSVQVFLSDNLTVLYIVPGSYFCVTIQTNFVTLQLIECDFLVLEVAQNMTWSTISSSHNYGDELLTLYV